MVRFRYGVEFGQKSLPAARIACLRRKVPRAVGRAQAKFSGPPRKQPGAKRRTFEDIGDAERRRRVMLLQFEQPRFVGLVAKVGQVGAHILRQRFDRPTVDRRQRALRAFAKDQAFANEIAIGVHVRKKPDRPVEAVVSAGGMVAKRCTKSVLFQISVRSRAAWGEGRGMSRNGR